MNGRYVPVKPNDVYGFWTVLEEQVVRVKVQGKEVPRFFLKCRCVCGKERLIIKSQVLHGLTKSCGCKSKLCCTKHGDRKKPLYSVWRSMRYRCNTVSNPAYKSYGGRGIKVCKEWDESYEAFRAWAYEHGYKEGLSIDRIDNNGNYCPENCRWVSLAEQQNNKRSNRYFIYNGKQYTLTQLAKLAKMSVTSFEYRISVKNMSVEEALTTPVRGRR